LPFTASLASFLFCTPLDATTLCFAIQCHRGRGPSLPRSCPTSGSLRGRTLPTPHAIELHGWPMGQPYRTGGDTAATAKLPSLRQQHHELRYQYCLSNTPGLPSEQPSSLPCDAVAPKGFVCVERLCTVVVTRHSGFASVSGLTGWHPPRPPDAKSEADEECRPSHKCLTEGAGASQPGTFSSSQSRSSLLPGVPSSQTRSQPAPVTPLPARSLRTALARAVTINKVVS
jgi:hypothetical protein